MLKLNKRLVKLCNLDYNYFEKTLIGRRRKVKLDKSYIANNWMKLLRIIGYVTLGLVAFFKLVTPKTIIDDYVKYGKDIAPSESTGAIGGLFTTVFGKAFDGLNGISPKLTSIVILLGAAILGICTLHMFMDKKPAKKK